jgi:hypothetical protein
VSLFDSADDTSLMHMQPSLLGNFSSKSTPYVQPAFAVGELHVGRGNEPSDCAFKDHMEYVLVSQDGAPTGEFINLLMTSNDQLKEYPVLLHCKALLAVIRYIPGGFHITQNYGEGSSTFFCPLITELLLAAGHSIGTINFTIAYGRQEQTNEHYNEINDAIYVSMVHEYRDDILTSGGVNNGVSMVTSFASWLQTRGPKGRLLIMFLLIMGPLDSLKYHIRSNTSDLDLYIETLLLTLLLDIAMGRVAYAKIKAGYVVQLMTMSEFWNVLITEFAMSTKLNGQGMDFDRLLEFIHNNIKRDNKRVFDR